MWYTFSSARFMGKEQPQQKMFKQTSLRDYWNNPTGHPLSHLATQPRRRTTPPGTTPPVWEQSGLLEVQFLPDAFPIEKSIQPDQGRPYGQALSGSEENQLPGSSPPVLRERLQRRGVASLSDAELFSIVLQPDQESESIE